MSEDLVQCEACGKPMPVGTYATDDDGVSACLPVMSDGAVDGLCVDEWEPIEGAPRDKGIIRARQGRWAPYHAIWNNDRWTPIEFNGSWHPTHWQPCIRTGPD